jgi:hypothetical protein
MSPPPTACRALLENQKRRTRTVGEANKIWTEEFYVKRERKTERHLWNTP